MDGGACGATVHGVEKSQTRLKQLSACTHTHTHTHTYSGFQNVNPISKETTLSTKIQFLCAISFVFSLTVFTHVQSYLFRSAPYFPIPLMIYKIQIVQNYNNKVKATHKAIHPLK